MSDSRRFAEMISKIAHELRSPLTSIKGFSSTLVGRWDRFSDEQRRELIETIHHDAERMGRIVAEVLDLARIESDRLELHRTVVSVRSLLSKAVDNHSAHPGVERVDLQVPEDLEAFADAERIGHVFSNLVENAIKFSEEGSIVVGGRRDGDTAEVWVQDQGVGIEPDLQEAIFDGPAPRSGHATPSGTGLGLYLSRRLVELHNGTITVESRPGEGTRFLVRLPGRQEPST